MLVYSFALTVGLVVSAPWWLLRMATTSRYREGLRQRLGGVAGALRTVVRGQRAVWVHAVSVGEVLAASRLVAELEATLGDGWRVVVSTTTRTGQALARERFGAERVFYMPLDFGWAVRAYMRALRPQALVLMESELWPRMLHECARAGVPVAVVNARVSDRSFARGVRARKLWGRVLRKVSLWLAQSEEDARRLVAMGAAESAVRVGGNLKYDVRAPKTTPMLEALRPLLERRRLMVAGSLLEGEERLLLDIWQAVRGKAPDAVLLMAPRHPERFAAVADLSAPGIRMYRASELLAQTSRRDALERIAPFAAIVLDTIGDLASVYSLADIAFVGGSLVAKGGHNPLEPAQFGVPVVMGPSYENFRGIVEQMKAAGGISIVGETAGLSTASAKNADSGRDDNFVVSESGDSGRDERFSVSEALEKELVRLLTDREAARAMGERGRAVIEQQQGATARAVAAVVAMIRTVVPQ